MCPQVIIQKCYLYSISFLSIWASIVLQVKLYIRVPGILLYFAFFAAGGPTSSVSA